MMRMPIKAATLAGFFSLIFFSSAVSFSFSGILDASYKVTFVIDANTLELSNGERVRLIAVKVAENGMAEHAKIFVRGLVQGKLVRIAYDRTNSFSNHRDPDGRILGYVWFQYQYRAPALTQEDRLLNAEIIKQGYAATDTRYPFSYRDQFAKYQSDAMKEKRGLWAAAV